MHWFVSRYACEWVDHKRSCYENQQKPRPQTKDAWSLQHKHNYQKNVSKDKITLRRSSIRIFKYQNKFLRKKWGPILITNWNQRGNVVVKASASQSVDFSSIPYWIKPKSFIYKSPARRLAMGVMCRLKHVTELQTHDKQSKMAKKSKWSEHIAAVGAVTTMITNLKFR